jgi:glutathione S-transferase
MITLHYSPGSANFAPHVLLHEIGVPFELALVDRANTAHKSPEYLKLNPNGLIPVLVDGELVLYESAAICLYLADSHPQAQLAPPLGSSERAHFYKWLVWLTNTVQANLIHYFYGERMVDPGNSAAAAQIKRHAQAKVGTCLQQIDQHLGQQGGPWMMGSRYSALDAYTWMLCRWTRNFDTQPAREYAHIAPFLHHMAARPALQRAVAAEGLAAPLF